MRKSQSLPQFNRLSVVTATILLTYALLPFIQSPNREISFRVFGILIAFQANFSLAIAFIAAGLAISGTDWIIRDHPGRSKQPVFPHYLLPTLTAAVLGVPLALLRVSIQWWVVFLLGSLLLLAVLMAEYISVDPADNRRALAQMVLNGVSFGLLLTLTISIRAAGLRLYLLLAALLPVFALICLRLFFLRLEGKWNWEWAAAITLIIVQTAIGFYYLPLAPARFGLILLGIAYGLIELAIEMQSRLWTTNKLISLLITTALFWLLALFIR